MSHNTNMARVMQYEMCSPLAFQIQSHGIHPVIFMDIGDHRVDMQHQYYQGAFWIVWFSHV